VQPLPQLDSVVEGELQNFRWILHPPRSRSDARWPGMWQVGVQLAIDYMPDDGQRRTLWLTTRPLSREAISRLGAGQLPRVAALFGPPPREFLVPEWAGEAMHGGDSWPQWSQTVAGEYSFDAQYRAAELLSLLDEPLHHLTAEWTASAADRRIAYSSLDPERAMPARWVDAERMALAQIPLQKLLPAGVVALLLAFWLLPRLFAPSRSSRWMGRLAALGLVLTVPLWSGHAERSATRIGISGWAHDAHWAVPSPPVDGGVHATGQGQRVRVPSLRRMSPVVTESPDTCPTRAAAAPSSLLRYRRTTAAKRFARRTNRKDSR
jgi:hypothetical protein